MGGTSKSHAKGVDKGRLLIGVISASSQGNTVPRAGRTGKLWCTSTFQASAWIVFTEVPLAKASGMANQIKGCRNINTTSTREGKNLWLFLQSSTLPLQGLPGKILTITKFMSPRWGQCGTILINPGPGRIAVNRLVNSLALPQASLYPMSPPHHPSLLQLLQGQGSCPGSHALEQDRAIEIKCKPHM